MCGHGFSVADSGVRCACAVLGSTRDVPGMGAASRKGDAPGNEFSMHTIVLATQKGGSGKSTLAIGLALAAQQAGHNVRLIETDKLGTLSKWQCRRGLAEPRVEPIYNAAEIEHRLQQLERSGVTLTIIDTASGITAATTAAIRHSDMTLIPSRPSIADIEATAATLSVIKAWKKP